MSLTRLAQVGAHLQNATRMHMSKTSIPFSRLNLNVCHQLYRQGFLSSLENGNYNGPDTEPVDITPDNISTRRIWLGLKYRDNKSVLSQFHLISKPSRRLVFSNEQLKELTKGQVVRYVKPLQADELILVKADKTGEVVELVEAAQRRLSGELLCRVK